MKKDTNTIQSQMKNLDNNIPPRNPDKAYAARVNFIRQAKIQRGNVTNPAFMRLTVWDRITQLKETKLMKLAGIVTIIALLLGGTGASVAAAQASMPGDLLYPVKILSEDIRLDLTANEENQFNLAMKFTQRRFDEIQTILEEEGTPSEEMMATYQNQIKHNLELALELDEPEEAIEEFQGMLQNQNQIMTQLKNGEEVEPYQFQMQSMMQYHLEIIEKGVQNLQMLQEQLQHQYQFGETIEPIQNQQQFQNEEGLGDQNKNNGQDETNGNNGQENQGPNTSDNGGNGSNGSGGGNGDGSGSGNGGGGGK
ncbi:MAG: hypothetical protein CL609_16210 [Anaerolineaceae bacterium]|nr:hypothetical protein [Anaerolineaceae bacterium]